MAVAAKIGTAARAQTTHAWAPAALACMGVVFSDIGTSPLYTLSVAAKVASPAGTVAPDAVLGIVSLQPSAISPRSPWCARFLS
jgi:KUP system potassium uptake protein